MSRCPKLDYESNGIFFNGNDKYICKLCGKQMDVDSAEVKYVCKGDDDAYYNCPIYKEYT